MNEDTPAITPGDSLGNNQENERHDMKFLTPTILAALLAGGSSLCCAQSPDQHGPGSPGSRGGPGDGPEGGHRPPPPIIEALDLNHDGVISADEIARAAESLKKLDKNGDGQLTPDELRPPRPQGERSGDQGGPGDRRPQGPDGHP